MAVRVFLGRFVEAVGKKFPNEFCSRTFWYTVISATSIMSLWMHGFIDRRERKPCETMKIMRSIALTFHTVSVSPLSSFSFFFFFFFAVRNDEFRAVTFEIKIIVRPDRCVYFFFSKGRSLYDARASLVYNILYARVQYISLSFI